MTNIKREQSQNDGQVGEQPEFQIILCIVTYRVIKKVFTFYLFTTTLLNKATNIKREQSQTD